MIELAINYNNDLITAKTLAARQEISEKYVEQIIGFLTRAELLISQRGAAGGYRLAKAPEDITVGDVIRATEDGIQIVDCVGDNAVLCEREKQCATFEVWQDVKTAVEDVVDNITLAELAKRSLEKQEKLQKELEKQNA